MTTTHTDTNRAAADQDHKKAAILAALRAWISQRPGLDERDYGGGVDGCRAYASELRSITKDLRDARELLQAVERSSITGAALLEAFRHAYSGRLSCILEPDGRARLEYATGQYWPTEYRKAAAAVAASALWAHMRDHIAPVSFRAESWADYSGGKPVRYHGPYRATREAASVDLEEFGGTSWGSVVELYQSRRGLVSAGDWLRGHFLDEFGRSIARRWFS